MGRDGWKRKVKGWSYIHTHPQAHDQRAIVESPFGISFAGKEFPNLAAAKQAALGDDVVDRGGGLMRDILERLRDLRPGYGNVIEDAIKEIEALRHALQVTRSRSPERSEDYAATGQPTPYKSYDGWG